MVFEKKWPKKQVVYLTKQFYEGDISIPWQLVIQLVQEYFRCETVWLGPSRKGRIPFPEQSFFVYRTNLGIDQFNR